MKIRQFVFIALLSVFLAACENPLFIQHTGLYKVEFSTNGGSSVDSVRTNKIKSAPQTTKENCEFEGWYESSDFRDAAVVFPFDVREDVTLYAKWLQKYTVSFDSDAARRSPRSRRTRFPLRRLRPKKTDTRSAAGTRTVSSQKWRSFRLSLTAT